MGAGQSLLCETESITLMDSMLDAVMPSYDETDGDLTLPRINLRLQDKPTMADIAPYTAGTAYNGATDSDTAGATGSDTAGATEAKNSTRRRKPVCLAGTCRAVRRIAAVNAHLRADKDAASDAATERLKSATSGASIRGRPSRRKLYEGPAAIRHAEKATPY